MVQDALDGKIDLIITKSVSRFARNTVDSLTTVRMLKEKGVEVFFEKESIFTLDSKGELLITIMSSLAQEESRSISENVTWGMRKRFADGKVALPYKQFLGYRKSADGLPEIVPEEAVIVKDIYRMFLEGKSPSYIARQLTTSGTPTPGGKANWRSETIKSILTNEKYKGDAILQKTFCTDFLTKRFKVNEGEVSQFYVENSHPAIIAPDTFDTVQAELKRRKQQGLRNCTPRCFSGRIYCGECGALYGSKVWNSTSKYKAVVWQCNRKYHGDAICNTPSLREATIQEAFVQAFNKVIGGKDEIIQMIEKTMRERCDGSTLDAQKAALQAELEIVAELMERHIRVNAHAAMDQALYQRQYDEYEARYNSAMVRLAEVDSQMAALVSKRGQLAGYLDAIRDQGPITAFNEMLWYGTVEQVLVMQDGKLRFFFKGGQEAEAK